MKPLLILLLVSGAPSGSVVVDRIAVIVGKQVIKSSDVDRDLRVTAFINRQPLNLSAAARRTAAERLIDQQIIHQELSAQGYSRPSEGDANQMLQQITKERFQGSTPLLQSALVRYGLSKDILRERLLWQLTVLRFIDQRFRPGILVTDEDVRAYYDQHLADLKREYPKDSSFQALSTKIRNSLEGQRIDQEFEAWLDEARKRNRIEYKEAAFQ
jgi:hypothetical protein